jgi:hypothetical protein
MPEMVIRMMYLTDGPNTFQPIQGSHEAPPAIVNYAQLIIKAIAQSSQNGRQSTLPLALGRRL